MVAGSRITRLPFRYERNMLFLQSPANCFVKELKWLERWVLPPLKLAYETCFFAESAPIEMVAGTGVEPVITNVMSVVW